jgi:hypothetical protein
MRARPHKIALVGCWKMLRVSAPPKLVDLCLHSIVHHFKKYHALVLPDELTVRLIELLNKRRKLNDNSLAHFLHSKLRKLDLTNCQNINIPQVTQACHRCSHALQYYSSLSFIIAQTAHVYL